MSGNIGLTASVSTDNVSIQPCPSAKRKTSCAADSLGEYEQTKKLCAFQPTWLGDFCLLRFLLAPIDAVNSDKYLAVVNDAAERALGMATPLHEQTMPKN